MPFSAREQAASFRKVVHQWGSSLDYRVPLYSDDAAHNPTLNKLLNPSSRPSSAKTRPTTSTASSASSFIRTSSLKENLENRVLITGEAKQRSPEKVKEPQGKNANNNTIFVVEGTARLRKELLFIKAQLADKEAQHKTALVSTEEKRKEAEEELRFVKEKFSADEKRLKQETSRLAQDLVLVEDALRKERKAHDEQEKELTSLQSSESFLKAAKSELEVSQGRLQTRIADLEAKVSATEVMVQAKNNLLQSVQQETANELRAWKGRCAKLMAHLEWRGHHIEQCDDLIEELEEYRRKQTPTLVTHLASRAHAGNALKTEAQAWESAYKAQQCEVADAKRRADERAELAEKASRTAQARAEDAERNCRLAEDRSRAAEDRARHAEVQARRAQERARDAETSAANREREAHQRQREAEITAAHRERMAANRERDVLRRESSEIFKQKEMAAQQAKQTPKFNAPPRRSFAEPSTDFWFDTDTQSEDTSLWSVDGFNLSRRQ